MSGQLLTAKQVAERLQIHEKTVRIKACRGEIEGIRTGGRTSPIRFTEAAVERFIERNALRASA